MASQLTAAENYLRKLHTQLDEVRDQLLLATSRWASAQGVTVGARRYGALHHNDPAYVNLRETVEHWEHEYRLLMDQQILEAKARLAQAQHQTFLQERDNWAESNHPELATRIKDLVSRLQSLEDPSSRQGYVLGHEIKDARGQLEKLWQQAHPPTQKEKAS